MLRIHQKKMGAKRHRVILSQPFSITTKPRYMPSTLPINHSAEFNQTLSDTVSGWLLPQWHLMLLPLTLPVCMILIRNKMGLTWFQACKCGVLAEGLAVFGIGATILPLDFVLNFIYLGGNPFMFDSNPIGRMFYAVFFLHETMLAQIPSADSVKLRAIVAGFLITATLCTTIVRMLLCPMIMTSASSHFGARQGRKLAWMLAIVLTGIPGLVGGIWTVIKALPYVAGH